MDKETKFYIWCVTAARFLPSLLAYIGIWSRKRAGSRLDMIWILVFFTCGIGLIWSLVCALDEENLVAAGAIHVAFSAFFDVMYASRRYIERYRDKKRRDAGTEYVPFHPWWHRAAGTAPPPRYSVDDEATDDEDVPSQPPRSSA